MSSISPKKMSALFLGVLTCATWDRLGVLFGVVFGVAADFLVGVFNITGLGGVDWGVLEPSLTLACGLGVVKLIEGDDAKVGVLERELAVDCGPGRFEGVMEVMRALGREGETVSSPWGFCGVTDVGLDMCSDMVRIILVEPVTEGEAPSTAGARADEIDPCVECPGSNLGKL